MQFDADGDYLYVCGFYWGCEIENNNKNKFNARFVFGI